MNIMRVIACVGFIVICAASLRAENSLTIESKTVPVGATAVEIRISFENEDTLGFFELPLEIRQVTPGSFVERMGIDFADRIGSIWQSFQFTLHYDRRAITECAPGGDSTFYPILDTIPYAPAPGSLMVVSGPPWGVLISAFRGAGESLLMPGHDTTGSVVLTLDVTSVPGTFEIDTTCVSPHHHPAFLRTDPVTTYAYQSVAFTKGVITIASCNCQYHGDLNGDGVIDAVDYNELINWVFYNQGPPPTDTTCPHIDRGDVNCDGFDDAVDVNYLSNHIYFNGPAPCDPCECEPYPTNCP